MRPGTSQPILVIASGNPYKVAEIRSMLDAVDLEVRQPVSYTHLTLPTNREV